MFLCRIVVEQLVKLPKTVSENRIQELTVEHIVVDIPVLQVAEELVKVSKVFPMDRIQQRFVEQTNENPDVSLAEKVFERPVTQTQQVVNMSVQHVFNTVEAEKHTNQVTRHIEIPMLQIIKKTVEVPEVPPVAVHRRGRQQPCRGAEDKISMVLTVQKSIEIPQLQHCDEVIDVPASVCRAGPTGACRDEDSRDHTVAACCAGSTSVGRGEDNRDPAVSSR